LCIASNSNHQAPLPGNFAAILERLAAEYGRDAANTLSREDGLRVDTPEGWIHLRASNTEPVFRVIGEWAVSPQHSLEQCNALLARVAQMAHDK
jgi:phosphomannomutase